MILVLIPFYILFNLFTNAIASWVDESSSDDDSFLIGGQFGAGFNVGDESDLIAGFGYYNFVDSRGEPAFFDGDSAVSASA